MTQIPRIVGLLCSLLGLLICNAAKADDKVYRLGVDANFYLPYYANADGQFIGYAREVFDLFTKETGVRFEYVPVLPGSISLLENGTIDLKFPDNPAWTAVYKKDLNLHYSQAISDYIDGTVVTEANMALTVKTVRKIGTIKGFTPLDYMILIAQNRVQLVEADSTKALLEMAFNGQIDGAYANIVAMQYYNDKVLQQSQKLLFNPQLPYSADSYFVSTLRYPEIIAALDRFLANHQQEINVIYQRYGLMLPVSH